MQLIKGLKTFIVTLLMVLAVAGTAFAMNELEGSTKVTKTYYMVAIGDRAVQVYDSIVENDFEVVTVFGPHEMARLIEDVGDWLLVQTDEGYGYIPDSDDYDYIEMTETDLDEESKVRAELVNFALQYLGCDYVWGGVDPEEGVDCSGFTQYVYKNVCGIELTHYSGSQANQGKKVTRDTVKPGDLVFYAFGGGAIDHVGMYIGNGQIVHAASGSAKVRIATIIPGNPRKYVNILYGYFDK